jgi:hypothetical protein
MRGYMILLPSLGAEFTDVVAETQLRQAAALI